LTSLLGDISSITSPDHPDQKESLGVQNLNPDSTPLQSEDIISDDDPFMKDTLKRVWLNETDPLAVCNDGSSAALYWRKKEGGSNKWLIYLEAGGQCYDEASCADRQIKMPTFMSSESYPEYMSISGVFAADEKYSTMHDANKAYLRYCSSDGHMGNVDYPNGSEYQFRGEKTVDAMIEYLIANKSLGSSPSDLVVFGGFSAGARGAMVHIDKISERLLRQKGMNNVKGLLDSPLYLDVEPLYPSNLTGLNY